MYMMVQIIFCRYSFEWGFEVKNLFGYCRNSKNNIMNSIKFTRYTFEVILQYLGILISYVCFGRDYKHGHNDINKMKLYSSLMLTPIIKCYEIKVLNSNY